MHSERRAALITGRNHHSVGFGVITEVSRVFRAMTPISVPENVTVGRVLSEHGYATSWFGKNHNTLATQFGVSGPFGQWPSGMGFDYFYGFMGGETDQWFPYLFRDHTQIFPWIDKPGYNLTTDLADEAIGYLDGVRAAAPDQPFFLYYAPGGSHAPHQPTPEWIEKFKGKFAYVPSAQPMSANPSTIDGEQITGRGGDVKNGAIFAGMFRNKLLHVHETGEWLLFDPQQG